MSPGKNFLSGPRPLRGELFQRGTSYIWYNADRAALVTERVTQHAKSSRNVSTERPPIWYYLVMMLSPACDVAGRPRMIPRGFPPRRPKIRDNVNEAIRAREVRAVFPDGSVEIMPTQQAIRKAQELGLDLILIAPTAEPPVAKAMDYGQWQYENKKKQHEAKKKQHVIQVKEIKFRPNTDDHDYDFKKNHAIRFLE